MNNFGALYCFELKKIAKRKIVWISAAVLLVIVLFVIGASLFGSYFVDGVKTDTHYHMIQVDREYQKNLDGRLIDQALLEEMQAGYGKIPQGVERYTLTEEYQTYARPYSAIFNFARQAADMTISEARQWQADEQDMYARRQLMLERTWESCFLTQEEKAFWAKQEQKLEWPIEFKYTDGYWRLYAGLNTIGLMALVVTAICLSGVFTEEHTRRTDQLILSSKYGRKTIYWAKFSAGASFAFLLTLAVIVTAFLAAFALYGAEGFSGALVLFDASYSWPLSVGEAVLISYGMMAAAVVLTGIFVMMLSELLHSSIGTLSIAIGIVILSLFLDIPEQYRVLSQIWSYLPSEFVSVWSVFDTRTVPLFGTFFTSWQVVPVLYAVFGAAFALAGKRAFVRYQVSGR